MVIIHIQICFFLKYIYKREILWESNKNLIKK